MATSISKAETVGPFLNCQKKYSKHNKMLATSGHLQNATPVKTDNAIAALFVADMSKQKEAY